MKTVTLEITQKDIDGAIAWKKIYNAGQGAPGFYNCNCVVARAAKRNFHNEVNVQPRSLTVTKHVKGEERNTYFLFDGEGIKFVGLYDDNKFDQLKPCTLTLTRQKG